ncbi:MAG: DegV family EDD domain-containing protein [bacterium]|nr:DegV family EDD domain-containing protein [bacterium]
MTVGIVTDSTAALPTEVQKRWDIAVVPLSLTVDGRTVQEGELATSEILAAKTYSSASPSPGAFAQAIAAQDQGQGVIVLTVAATLSSTYQAASLAAQQATCPTQIVDSRTAAGGLALVAIAAARASHAGANLTDVAAAATHVTQRIRLLGALGNLDQLIRSGRVPELAGRTGNRLGVRPLFQIRHGAIAKMRPALSDHAATQRLLALWRRTLPHNYAQTQPAEPDASQSRSHTSPHVNSHTSPHVQQPQQPQLYLVSLHAEAPQHAQALLDAVTVEVPPAESFISGFGQAMMINSGIGVRGLAWYWD